VLYYYLKQVKVYKEDEARNIDKQLLSIIGLKSLEKEKTHLFCLRCLQSFHTHFGRKIGHLWSHVVCFNDTFATHNLNFGVGSKF
jgi:hypothetical protein